MKVLFRIYLLVLFASYSHEVGEENNGFRSGIPNEGSNFAEEGLPGQKGAYLVNQENLRMKGNAALLAFPLQTEISGK